MLELLGALAAAAAPALALLWYFYRRDRARPEPLGLIGKSVLYGFIAVLPAAAIEFWLDRIVSPGPGLAGILFESFVVAATVEESMKLFFVKRYLFHRPEFDERADGVVYAICVSLGFAFIENFLYGYRDFRILLFRAFTSVPLHAVAAGLMGYYLGRAKIEKGPGDAKAKRRASALASAKGLAWAILIHGLYDFFIMLGGAASLLVLPVLVLGWVSLSLLYRRAIALDNADAGLASSQNLPPSIL